MHKAVEKAVCRGAMGISAAFAEYASWKNVNIPHLGRGTDGSPLHPLLKGALSRRASKAFRLHMKRPAEKPKENRTETLIFRITRPQKKRVEKEAKSFHMEPNAYARLKVLGERVAVRRVRELPPEVTLELGRIGVNLNQIARRLNMTGEYEPEELAASCGRLEELLGIILSTVIEPAND
jgi:hypothetical protein